MNDNQPSGSRPDTARDMALNKWWSVRPVFATAIEGFGAGWSAALAYARSEPGLTAGFSDQTVANVRAWMVANIDAEKDDDNPESVRLLEKINALLGERSDSSGPRFANVSCSQCGGEFGPGDHGFSHCDSHRTLKKAAPK